MYSPNSQEDDSRSSSLSKVDEMQLAKKTQDQSFGGSQEAQSELSSQQAPQSALKITLKIGRDKLRNVTESGNGRASSSFDGQSQNSSMSSVASSVASDDSNDEYSAHAHGLERMSTRKQGRYDNENEREATEEQDDNAFYSNMESDDSRANTPDVSKLTKRQRSKIDDVNQDLLELPTDRVGRKNMSVEEQALKRAEMARRRKHLTDKRVEEEKMGTINRLLRKQAVKSRKGTRTGTGEATPVFEEDGTHPSATNTLPQHMTRWVSTSSGSLFTVPSYWLKEKPTVPKEIDNI